MSGFVSALIGMIYAFFSLFTPAVPHDTSQTSSFDDAPAHTTASISETPVAAAPAISAMKHYSDTEFGFSFWYPNTWEISSIDVENVRTAYSGGEVVKRLRLTISDDKAFTVDSFNSSAATISPGYSGSTGAGCRITYAFSHESQWTESTSGCDGPETLPADISHSTMGGLHTFQGAAGLNPQVIVPLSAHHFVVVTYQGDVRDGSPPVDPMYLVNTIAAADPSVATPVSQGEQKAVIEAARQAYSGQ